MKRLIMLLGVLFLFTGMNYAWTVHVELPDSALSCSATNISIPVYIYASENMQLDSYNFKVAYDTTVLNYTGLTGAASDVVANANNGNVAAFFFTVDNSKYVPLSTVKKVLFYINFQYKGGATNLTFNNVSFHSASPNGVPPFQFKNGSVSSSAANAKVKIEGTVWIDSNNDGLLDNSENGLQDVTVEFYNCSGNWLGYTLTDANGHYSVDTLIPGSYYEKFYLVDGNNVYTFIDSSKDSPLYNFTDSTATSYCTSISACENSLVVNAGVKLKSVPVICDGTIGDFIWEDTNQNGIQDDGSTGLKDVLVKLLDCDNNDTVLDSTATDTNGMYSFTHLKAGDYKIEVVPPADYIFTSQNAGSDTTKDSNINSTSHKSGCVSISSSNQEDLTIDAGLYKPAIVELPNLCITKDDGLVFAPDSGNTTTYKITYENTGKGPLYNATIMDTLPNGLGYVTSTGGVETSSGSNIVKFVLGTLNAGDNGQVQLTAAVNKTLDNYLNMACLSGTDGNGKNYVKCAVDIDIKDTTSNCDHGGVESRGDMAELLIKRQWKIKYGLTTPMLSQKAGKTIESQYSLSQFIPAQGPFNSVAQEATPFDILGISNAISSYAVNYNVKMAKGEARVGGIFSTVTPAPNIYDHLKAVCDRLAGYQIDNIKLISINDHQFYAAKLAKPDEGISDYAISFSVYETPSGYQIENKWTYENYVAPSGASSVYNFQIWSSSYESTAELVQEVIAKFKAVNSVTYLNTNQVQPNIFIQSAKYTHDGKVHLRIINNGEPTSVALNTAYRVAQAGHQVQVTDQYKITSGINDLVLNSGIISDANIYMSQTAGFSDEVFVSGGAYTYIAGPNSTVDAFDTQDFQQQIASNYPDNSLVLSGGASASGTLNDWVTVIRSLNAEGTPYDLSNYNALRFEAHGSGSVEVIFNLANTKNYNYFAYKINLTPDSKEYVINFNQFKQLYGSDSKFDASLIEHVGFIMNTTDNSSNSNFNFLVKNIAFLNNGVTGVEDQSTLPTKFDLAQNYPNPFNPSTVIEFSVPQQQRVMLNVYNTIGQKVMTLVNGELNPGTHHVTFDATSLPSGIYFYRLIGENVNITKKMILTK